MNNLNNYISIMPLRILNNDIFALSAWGTSAIVAVVNTFSEINFSPFITAVTFIVGIVAAIFKGRSYYYEYKIKQMTYEDMKEEHDNAENDKQDK